MRREMKYIAAWVRTKGVSAEERRLRIADAWGWKKSEAAEG
jgi:hypothetical protein